MQIFFSRLLYTPACNLSAVTGVFFVLKLFPPPFLIEFSSWYQSGATHVWCWAVRWWDSTFWGGNFWRWCPWPVEAARRSPLPITCKSTKTIWNGDKCNFCINGITVFLCLWQQDVEIIEDGAKHILTLYNCKVSQSGEVTFQGANAKCSANLKVKGILCGHCLILHDWFLKSFWRLTTSSSEWKCGITDSSLVGETGLKQLDSLSLYIYLNI